jgi:ubiquinol-cytochrome c reductase cytochrome b/c1 subunit
LHYLLPFVITGLVFLHLALLHIEGSTNPMGVNSKIEKIGFYPYFYLKDLFAFLVFLTFYSTLVFYYPNLLGHPDNYIPANALVTPPHIVPEWYFLPFYAILRSISDKLLGVVMMFLAILSLLCFPLMDSSRFRSPKFRPVFKFLY